MEITNLLWHDIEVEHLRKKMPTDKMAFAHIIVEKDTISLIEYDKYHYSTGNHHLYGKPKIIRLTAHDCEFEAEWWGTVFKTLKNSKTKMIELPTHKVKITAKF